jgi:hypothetical protein
VSCRFRKVRMPLRWSLRRQPNRFKKLWWWARRSAQLNRHIPAHRFLHSLSNDGMTSPRLLQPVDSILAGGVLLQVLPSTQGRSCSRRPPALGQHNHRVGVGMCRLRCSQADQVRIKPRGRPVIYAAESYYRAKMTLARNMC